MDQLQGKVVLVTGGGSGIGRAAALACAREGARVALADILVEGSEETVEMIRGLGAEAAFFKTDVSQTGQVEAMVRDVVGTFGRLDCAFNNAGIGGGASLTHKTDEEHWDRMMSINLKGVWLCMKYEIPQMLDQGSGAIVNTSSVAGVIAFKGTPAYVAAKHAVVGLTKAAALEYATSGIRVNAVCPGVIHTPLIDRNVAARPQLADYYKNLHPIGRLGEAEEVAEAAVWLMSDAASFVTGHALVVDGGLVAQ